MGKVVERKKKKKKGRPSLLDLQKRNLKEQQQQQQQQQHQRLQHKRLTSAPHSSPNYNSATPTPLRRSTRRNPLPDDSSSDKVPEEDDDDDDLAGKRREKQLKLVLKLPSTLNSGGSDSNADDDNATSNHKKRKINAIADGSETAKTVQVEKSVLETNAAKKPQGATQDSGPSTPLPDKKLLLFILERLQKKDTYGVFSEPVDPEELPDYHEVIEHPMDFGTVKRKLTTGAYANLEQFEKDIFLICSNAMEYNAPDTIYFRQARSIHELAKKNFENLRQDSDNEAEPKIVRRGRPPTKHFKNPPGRPPLDRAPSEFSSDATLATGPENNALSNHDTRKGTPFSDRSGFADSSGRFHGSRNDVYTSWLAENKFDKNDDGSMWKGSSIKHGKKQMVLDDNRRSTYKKFHPSAGGRGSSVLTTFDGERKQLMAVGLLSEHGYARSLARFAANLGPTAWALASKRIERCLPAGVKFGPGWVGENDVAPQRSLQPVPSLSPGQPQSLSVPENASSVATSFNTESRDDKLTTPKPEGDVQLEEHGPLAHPTSEGHSNTPLTDTKSSERTIGSDGRFKSQSAVNVRKDNSVILARPPFHNHQSPVIHPGMNGLNGAYGFSIPGQMGKLIGLTRLPGYDLHSSQMLDSVSRSNTNPVHPMNAKNSNSGDSRLCDSFSMPNSSSQLLNSGTEALAASRSGLHAQPPWQGLSPQQKSELGQSQPQKRDSGPPDLNVRFQSPGSPSSSRADSMQPDLALQL